MHEQSVLIRVLRLPPSPIPIVEMFVLSCGDTLLTRPRRKAFSLFDAAVKISLHAPKSAAAVDTLQYKIQRHGTKQREEMRGQSPSPSDSLKGGLQK